MSLTWTTILLSELSARGLKHVFIAPGSRSTPLVLAAANDPKIKTIVHIDERGAAFAALGVGKITGVPAGVITTSGTAVANCFPAVIEAAQSGTPLIVLSADRPAELRGTGSNQTINQVEIFGRYPTYFADLPCPGRNLSAEQMRTVTRQAMAASASGPAHLNLQFTEPLFDPHERVIPDCSTSASVNNSLSLPITVADEDLNGALNILNQAKSGLVVCGAMSPGVDLDLVALNAK